MKRFVFIFSVLVLGNSIPAWAKLGVDYQMALGNPTAATTDPSKTNNYLIARSQFTLSYNGIHHQPNWVSWSYSTGDSGSSGRTDAWSEETALPAGYYRVGTATFGSSFGESWDRGHMCPSADRTFSVTDNEFTFRMSNMIPQAAQNNQGLWANFETYTRGLASDGDEILIICGPAQFTGNRIPNQMSVPGSVWKIIVEVPNAASTTPAHQRVTTNSRVIAILTPNTSTGLGTWESYITSVEEIEQITGFNFFSNVNPAVATYLKNVVDTGTGPNKPTVITSFSPASGPAGTIVTISGYNFGTSPVVEFNGVGAVASVSGGNTITATVPAGAGTGPITVTGTGGTDTSATDYSFATGTEPALSLSTGAISSLASIQGSAGTSQSYTVTGSNLTGTITVTAPTNFEVSLNNSSFAGSQTISPTSGSVSQTLYVRIKSTAPLGSVSGTITHSGGGAATQNLSVSGTVASNQPSITLSATSLTGFSALQGSASTSKSYTVSGVNLSGAITVTPPSGYEISTNNSTFVTTSISLTPSGTTLDAKIMYVRIRSSAEVGAVSGSINHSGGGANSVNLSVSGNVTASGVSASEHWFAISGSNTKGAPNISQSFGNKTGVWINEFHYDTAGTDSGEFLEVVVAPNVTTSLTNISVVLINYNLGTNGVPTTQDYGTHSLNTFQEGFSVNGYRVFFKDITGIQNGPTDGFAVTVDGAVVQFLSYEGIISGTSGVTTGLTSTDIGVSESGAPIGSSLQLTGGPIITSPNAVTATNYASFSYQITASNNPVSYNASGLPNGLTINTTNGLISGTPTVTPGTYTVGLSAINSAGEGTQNLTLTLLKNPGAPTITSAANTTAYLRSAFSFTATANPAADSFSFAGLPGGLTSSGATISGTPTNAGTFTVGITATNSLGSDAQNLTLTVLDPVITLSTNSLAGLSSISGKEGSVQSYTVSGSNLTSNVTVTAPTHFRISDDGVNFTNNPITLTPSGGTLSGKTLFVSLATNAPVGVRSGTVTHAGGGAVSQNLSVSGTVSQPQISLSTSSLSGFSTRVGVASAAQNYTVSGTELTGGLTVTAPAGFEVSTDNISFTESLLLIPSSGSLSIQTIHVRISTGAGVGSLSGNITHEGGDAASQNLAVSGTVVQPSISLSANSLAAFTADLGTASSAQTYTVSGSNLTGSITVSAPAGFEVSLDGSSYGSSRTLVPLSGTLSAQIVYARLASSAPLGPSAGTITHNGGDAAQQGVAISGNVISTSPVLTLSAVSLGGFSALAGFAGDSQSYTLSGSSLTNQVIVTAPAGFELSLDQATYATSLTLSPSAGAIHNLPIFVRLESTTVAGPVEGIILHSSGGAEAVSLMVSGTVTEATAGLTLSTAALTGFSATAGTSGASQLYQVSGVYLKGPITVTPSSPFEVSQDGTNFATNLTLVPSGGALSNVAVRVRISSLASAGALSGTVLHAGGGASNQILSVSGQVSAPAAPPAIISTLSGGVYTNSTFSYTIAVVTNTNTNTNTTYTYSASNLPAGFTINASTGLISGTSTNSSRTNLIQLFASSTQGVASATYRLRTMTAAEQTNLPLSVVVNKFLNSTVDRIELLVTGDDVNGPPVDLRGMVVKDTSSTMTEDFGGKFVLNDIPFWSRVKAGTLIVLSAGTTTPEDLDPSDFVLWVNLGNPAYVTTAAGGFDIGNTEMVIVKTADGGADGVAGGIHALAVGSLGAQYNNFKGKKISNTLQLNNKGNKNPTGPVAGVLNNAANLSDFTVASGVGYSTNTNFFGSPNSTGNSNFITALRAKDQDGPVITVVGANPMTIAQSTNLVSFVDPGASAFDTGDNTNRPVATNGTVSNSVVGTYSRTYTATDSKGNMSTVTRVVHVVDQTRPIITLSNPAIMQISFGAPYQEPGYSVQDNVDQDLDQYVQIFRPIQAASLGSSIGNYELQYVVTDFSGNVSDTVTRTVQVVKATPTITNLPVASPIFSGQPLGASTLSGGGADVPGTFVWGDPSFVPPVGTNSYSVTFIPGETSNYNTVTNVVSLTVNASLFASWVATYGLSGSDGEAGADPDGDGFANLAEYALGGNPTNATGSFGPSVSTTNTSGTNWMRFTYRARTNDGALVIQPVFKVSLTETNWSTNGVVQKVSGQPAGDGEHEDQVWQTTIGSDTKKFLKLNISR